MDLVSLLLFPLILLAVVLLASSMRTKALRRLQADARPLVDQVNALLPQTQCGQCGHPGCKPYAESIAAGGAINKCPPGGAGTIKALAKLMGAEPAPLDPTHGIEGIRKVAYIREPECIGCTKCIQACPVDAILGSAKHMHTVIVSECTGCDLCVEPCPVDCIDMIPAQTALQRWHWQRPAPHSASLIATTRQQAEA